ncbi:MAG: tetratricopeptide repeat-containing sensor histidine kinase [Janthinobacterium lividum]
MKLYGYLLLLLLLATAARAQNRRADSLTAAMRYNPRSDMSRGRPMAVVPTLPLVQPPNTFEMGLDSALTAARQRGDWRAEAAAHRYSYGWYWRLGKTKLALDQMRQAQAIAAWHGDQLLQAWFIYLEARDYIDTGHHEQSIELLNQALALIPPGRRGMRADAYANISLDYAELGDEAEAARYERLAIRDLAGMRSAASDRDTCSRVLYLLGTTNLFRKHWAKAEHYYTLAIREPHASPDDVRVGYMGLAGSYTWQNKPELALRCLRPYLAEVMRDSTDALMVFYRQILATGYYENHQPDSARLHNRVALALARRIHNHFSAYWACWALAGAAAEQHDYARAWHYQRLSIAYQDSMHVEETGRRVEFARHNTTVAQQQARIALLTKDQELARLRQQRTAIGLALLALLLAGGVGAAVYGVRQRQRRREAALRRQLAADLHDDVGSLLTRLSLESSLLSEGLRPPHEQQRQLAALVSVSQQALRQMRDVVWSIGPDHDTLPHLLDQMREHGYDLLAAAGLDFDFQADEGVAQAELPTLARQHLYLIYKEALHNAVKHAQGASTLRVRLTLADAALCLTVRDDGAGTASPGRPSGLGLTSMRQRAEAVGGTVAYDTAPGQGFTVAVRLPLAGQHLPPALTPEEETVGQPVPSLGWLEASAD